MRTIGNSDFIEGVDIPVLLNSTPAETGPPPLPVTGTARTDSAFTTMVLELEQQKLDAQAHKAKLILSKAGELMDYREYRTAWRMRKERYPMNLGAMLNAYPDSMGGNLSEIARTLNLPQLRGAFPVLLHSAQPVPHGPGPWLLRH